MILADMGAEVLKVERPGKGDSSRAMGDGSERNPFFRYINRNKKSVALDYKSPAGREVFLRLVRSVDVLVENYRAGVMERAGFGYDVLSGENPRLVYAQLSGFGADGPYRNKGGVDLIAQGMGGLMQVTGEPDGPPTSIGQPICDLGTGMWGVQGILAALLERERTGRGQKVDCSLLETAMGFSGWTSAAWLVDGKEPTRQGARHRQNAPYQRFATQDGYMMIGAATQDLWERCARALGRAEWIADPRFQRNARPDPAPSGAGEGDRERPRDGADGPLGRGARPGRGALRSRQHVRAALRRSAGSPPGHGDARGGRGARPGAPRANAGASVAEPDRGEERRAAARRPDGRGAGSARLRAGGDRGAAPRPRDLTDGAGRQRQPPRGSRARNQAVTARRAARAGRTSCSTLLAQEHEQAVEDGRDVDGASVEVETKRPAVLGAPTGVGVVDRRHPAVRTPPGRQPGTRPDVGRRRTPRPDTGQPGPPAGRGPDRPGGSGRLAARGTGPRAGPAPLGVSSGMSQAIAVTSNRLVDTIRRAPTQSRRTEPVGRGQGLDGVVDADRRRVTEHAIEEKPPALAERADVGIREDEGRGHGGVPALILLGDPSPGGAGHAGPRVADASTRSTIPAVRSDRHAGASARILVRIGATLCYAATRDARYGGNGRPARPGG